MVIVVPRAVGGLDPTTVLAVTRAAPNGFDATPTSQTTHSASADKAQRSPFRCPRRSKFEPLCRPNIEPGAFASF